MQIARHMPLDTKSMHIQNQSVCPIEANQEMHLLSLEDCPEQRRIRKSQQCKDNR